MVNLPEVNLGNLAGGAAAELFEQAYRKILESIEDPNTPWKGTRRITMKFDFAVNEARDQGVVALSCETKMPASKPVTTPVFINRHHGAPIMVEPLRQEELFTEPIGRPRAVASAVPEEDQP